MNKQKIILIIFIVVALAQILFAVNMILESEKTLSTGTEFWFRTTPIDPNDPFRGKYITLNYSEDSYTLTSEEKWKKGEEVFVSFIDDQKGFAKINNITKTEPENTEDYIKTTIYHVQVSDSTYITINYPFERYYMEESKANEAENIYFETIRDTASVTYSVVKIKKGKSVLQDVIIDGVSIVNIIKERRGKN